MTDRQKAELGTSYALPHDETDFAEERPNRSNIKRDEPRPPPHLPAKSTLDTRSLLDSFAFTSWSLYSRNVFACPGAYNRLPFGIIRGPTTSAEFLLVDLNVLHDH